jgi:hypothetical protein
MKSTRKNKPKKNTENNNSTYVFDITSLKEYLKSKIPHLSALDFDIIQTIFGKKQEEYQNLLDNVINEKRSDSIICYGNNNQVLKVFLDNAIKHYSEEIDIKKIEINGYFDTNEEVLLKEICHSLELHTKAGYDNYKKELDNYFLKKTKDDSLIVIYCDYIDHLVHKKKQRLLYTLFELVNKSKNILFIGFTYNYNLMDQMEKRIRSRSSQKTMYINIENYKNVINGLEKCFNKKYFLDKNEGVNDEENNEINSINNEEKDTDTIGKKFFECLIHEETGDYVNYLKKLVKMGTSIEGILTKIQHHLLLIQIEIGNFHKIKDTNKLNKEDLIKIIQKITRDITENERRGYTYNMLLKCTKFQKTLFIGLTSCVSNYTDKVELTHFYNHFKKIAPKYIAKGKRSDFDLILVQKFLEDLNNCNLISIKNDEKYGKVYQLKLPLCEIKKILRKMKENKLLDAEMIKLMDNIR